MFASAAGDVEKAAARTAFEPLDEASKDGDFFRVVLPAVDGVVECGGLFGHVLAPCLSRLACGVDATYRDNANGAVQLPAGGRASGRQPAARARPRNRELNIRQCRLRARRNLTLQGASAESGTASFLNFWQGCRPFFGVTYLFRRLRLPRAVRPAIGGLLVGLLGLVIPQALGMGYGWVQVGMDQRLLGLPLWLVLVIPFAKILATSLSIGSGGSGGIFGPGMVIGGLLGASFWRLTYGVLPGMPATATPFVIVAMMALFGGIAHAPLAVMLMVGEMTGNLSLLAPAMIAVGIASWIVGENTIYTSQLPTRADSPAHKLEFSFHSSAPCRCGRPWNQSWC